MKTKNILMEKRRKRELVILTFIILIFLHSSLSSSETQLTFLMDLDNPVFNFSEERLSPLNESKATIDVLFYGDENSYLDAVQISLVRLPASRVHTSPPQSSA